MWRTPKRPPGGSTSASRWTPALDFGLLGDQDWLLLYSEMGEGGVIFADGIESDSLEFLTRHVARIRLSTTTLNLVVPAG